MTMLTRWDPLRELDSFQNRLADFFGRAGDATGAERNPISQAQWAPSVDITEDDHGYVIEAELPKVDKDKITVRVDNGVLTLSGEREYKKEEKSTKVHRVERAYGKFVRSFNLPDDADDAGVNAEYKDGVLIVRVPKAEDRKPKQIEIKVK
jgi:HSP20 family protein